MTEVRPSLDTDVIGNSAFPLAGGEADRKRLANVATVGDFARRLPFGKTESRIGVLPAWVFTMPESEMQAVRDLYKKSPLINPDGLKLEQWDDLVSANFKGPLLEAMPQTWDSIQEDLKRLREACRRDGVELVPDSAIQINREDPSKFADGRYSTSLGRIRYAVRLDPGPTDPSYVAGSGVINPGEEIRIDPYAPQFAFFKPDGPEQRVTPREGEIMREDPFTVRYAGDGTNGGITTTLLYGAALKPEPPRITSKRFGPSPRS